MKRETQKRIKEQFNLHDGAGLFMGETLYETFGSVGHVYLCRASKRCVKVAHAQRINLCCTHEIPLFEYNYHMLQP